MQPYYFNNMLLTHTALRGTDGRDPLAEHVQDRWALKDWPQKNKPALGEDRFSYVVPNTRSYKVC